MRKKLVQLIREVTPYWAEVLADYLMRNGVVIPVRCKDCRYYKEDGEYCGNWGECRHPEHFCDEGVS